jgi:hypothetical protein
MKVSLCVPTISVPQFQPMHASAGRAAASAGRETYRWMTLIQQLYGRAFLIVFKVRRSCCEPNAQSEDHYGLRGNELIAPIAPGFGVKFRNPIVRD